MRCEQTVSFSRSSLGHLWVPWRRLRSRGAEEGSREAYGAVEAGKEFGVQQGGRAGVQLALPPEEGSRAVCRKPEPGLKSSVLDWINVKQATHF